MKNAITILSIVLIFCSHISAQTNISGSITDATTGETLIGVNVLVAGESIGTVTDYQGNYELTIYEDEVLQVSYTGYTTQNISVSNTGDAMSQDIILSPDSQQLESIIVTANRQSQSIQDVPASITAISPLELRRSGAREFRDFASSVPNLSFGSKGGQGALSDGRTSNQIVIRGIAGPNTTAVYLDDTPLPANISPRLTDVARVEVLRGPQGTLYGSSSMGGAVKTITNQPNVDAASGSVSVSAATVQEGDLDYDIEGIINIPLSEQLAFRASAFYEFETGVYDREINGEFLLNTINPWQENAFGETTNFNSGSPINISTDGCANCQTENTDNVDDERNYGFNASLAFTPNDNISIVPRVIYQNQSGDGLDFADNRPDNFTQIRYAGLPEEFSDEWTHYSLSAKFDIGYGELISSTSYTNRSYNEIEDFTEFLAINLELPWSAGISRGADYEKFVQELRYHSQLDGRFNFAVGAFYATEELKESGAADTPGLTEWLGSENPMFWEPEFGGIPDFLWDIPFWRFNNNLTIDEFSLFGEVYFDISDKLSFNAGLRYFDATIERQYNALGVPTDFNEIITNANISENGINPKFNLNYKVSESNLIYATVAKGFRLGGVNDPVPLAFCGDELAALGESTPDNYESDDLWNYEIGYKGVSSNGKMTFNTALFYNKWTGIQQLRRLSCGFGYVANAGAANIYGIDVDAKAKLSRDWEIGVGLGIMNPEISEGGMGLDAEEGHRILFTPTTTASINIKYFRSLNDKLSLFGNANWNYVSERFSTYSAQNPNTEASEVAARTLDPYSLANIRVGLSSGNWELSLFANNITNTAANFGDVISLAAETSGRPRYQTSRPRTIGVQLRSYF